jgi:hypothetical protein
MAFWDVAHEFLEASGPISWRATTKSVLCESGINGPLSDCLNSFRRVILTLNMRACDKIYQKGG